jgi:hypothetical protein
MRISGTGYRIQLNNGCDQNMLLIILQVKMLQQAKMSVWQNVELH